MVRKFELLDRANRGIYQTARCGDGTPFLVWLEGFRARIRANQTRILALGGRE